METPEVLQFAEPNKLAELDQTKEIKDTEEKIDWIGIILKFIGIFIIYRLGLWLFL